MGRAVGLNDNPPLLAFLHKDLRFQFCYGCKAKFAPSLKQSPNEFNCKNAGEKGQLVNQKWIPGWKKSWAYFHLSLGCLKLEKSVLEIEDIYIPNDIRDALTPAHVCRKVEEYGLVGQVEEKMLIAKYTGDIIAK